MLSTSAAIPQARLPRWWLLAVNSCSGPLTRTVLDAFALAMLGAR